MLNKKFKYLIIMKKKILLGLTLIVSVSFRALSADPVLPDGMTILTPEGVVVTTSSVRAYDKDKPLTVAGSKGKGYKVYFTAKEDTHGEELWVSDGTVDGTKMVKDIYPGATSSNVCYITRFNDKVVFQATANDEDGAELWISDGTEEGTHMIMDINILGGSEPCGFTQLDENHFVFAAKDYESEVYGSSPQRWLWISDGTEEGTKLLKDCNVKYPGTNTANDRTHFVRVGRKVFFKADTKDNQYGEELWVTDGTEEGTFMPLDINTTIADLTTGATGGAQLDWFTNFNNEKLFFQAYSKEYGNEPWVSDGTIEGTHMIVDQAEGVNANGLPLGYGTFTTAVYKNNVYFRGYHPIYGLELFRTDFTPEGTYMVADLNKNQTTTGTANGSPDIFCEFDGVLFMKAATGSDPAATDPINYGLELFYTDGTEEGTKMQSDLNPGIGPNAAWEGIVISGSFYFRAQDQTPPTGSSQFWELFRINDKDEFPIKVADLGEGPDFVHSLRNCNGDLFFTSQIIKRLFKYHYRKPNYDPQKDVEEMDPDFGPTTGLKSPKLNIVKSISIYPNPAKDKITINSTTDIKGYTITDLSGRRVGYYKGSDKIISVSNFNLAKGSYVLSVENEIEEVKIPLIIQ